MKSFYKKVDEIIADENCCPFPLDVIPNNMGINLGSVDAISWQEQDDGQLVHLTIHFFPHSETVREALNGLFV